MYRSSARRLSASVVSLAAGLFLSTALFGAQKIEPKAGARVVKPRTAPALRSGVSQPMRLVARKPSATRGGTPRPMPLKPPQLHPRPDAPTPHDPLIQRRQGAGLIPDPIASFDGVGDVDGVQPADTTMDVSPAQVLQWVNLS